MIRTAASAIFATHLYGLLLMGPDLAGTWNLNLGRSTAQIEYASDILKIEQTGSLTYLFTGCPPVAAFHISGIPIGMFDRRPDVPNVTGMKLTQPMSAATAYELQRRSEDETAKFTEFRTEPGRTQNGVISLILMNLFMHYAFDVWMKRTYPS